MGLVIAQRPWYTGTMSPTLLCEGALLCASGEVAHAEQRD